MKEGKRQQEKEGEGKRQQEKEGEGKREQEKEGEGKRESEGRKDPLLDRYLVISYIQYIIIYCTYTVQNIL